MSDQTTTFEVLLKDGVSKVAKFAASGFDKISKSGQAAVKAVQALQKGTSAAGKSLAVGAFAFNQISDATGRAFDMLEGFAKSASDLQAQKNAFAKFGEAGIKAFDDIRKYGDQAGLDIDKVGAHAKRLLNVTNDLEETDALIKLAADGARAGALGAEGIDKLIEKFAELRNKEGIAASDLEGFAKDAGNLNLDAFIDKIADASGTSALAVKKLAKDGKLSFNEMMQGYQLLSEAKLGTDALGLGAISAAAKDPLATLERLSNVWKTIRERLASGLFSEETLVNINKFIDALVATDGPLDKTLSGAQKVFNFLMGVDWKLIEAGIIGLGVALAVSYAPAMYAAGAAALAAAPAVLAAAAPFLAVAAAIAAVVYYWDDISNFFTDTGHVISEFVGGAVETMGKFFDELPNKFMTFGADIIQGLIDGITAKITALKSAATNIANSIKDTFKGLLGIASPSKVFEEFGVNTVQGYEKGIDKEASTGSTQRSIEKFAPTKQEIPSFAKSQNDNDEAAAAQSMSRAAGYAGQTASSNTITFGDIYINGASTDKPSDFAEEFVMSVTEQLKVLRLQGV